jgi:transcriptional regulator with XRE-family HTH domain
MRKATNSGHASAKAAAGSGRAASAGVGTAIRTARQGRYSLEQLSAKSGVSAGLLSQIERGLGNPSVTTLIKIANGLGVPVGSLFHFDGVPQANDMIVRSDERRKMDFPKDKILHELLTPDLQGHFAVMRSVLPAGYGGNAAKPQSHPGEEFLLVVSGRLALTIETVVHFLDPGDSITFDSARPHIWGHAAGGVVELLCVVNPPPW